MKKLLIALLIVAVALLGYFYYSDNTLIADKITVYNQGKEITIAPDTVEYNEIVQVTERAVESIDETYKGIRETPDLYTDSVLTVKIELGAGSKIVVNTQDVGREKMESKLIVIPLEGSDYESNVITIGSERGLGMYKTSQKDLVQIKQLADRVVSQSK